MAPAFGILLAGGRSARMGTDKLELVRDGRTLGGLALDALLTVADRVVVSSPYRPELDDPRVAFALEDPPLGGPVAGMAATLGALGCCDDDAQVYLLAGDLAEPGRVIAALRGAQCARDGAALVDAGGWVQYLAGRYRFGALRAALDGDVRDRSVRRTLRGLELARVPVGPDVSVDIDTPEQAHGAGFTHRPSVGGKGR